MFSKYLFILISYHTEEMTKCQIDSSLRKHEKKTKINVYKYKISRQGRRLNDTKNNINDRGHLN